METLKRALAVCLVLGLCLGMTGCGGETEEICSFRLRMETEEAVARISWEYYASGEILGSGGVQRADGKKMNPGENVTFSFFPEDFPEGVLPENVTVSLVVWGCSGEGTPVDRKITVHVSSDAIPEYTLLGNSSGGYRLIGPT